jgi:hypothetical protein
VDGAAYRHHVTLRTSLPADDCGEAVPPGSEPLSPELPRSKAKPKRLGTEIPEAAYGLKGACFTGNIEESEAAGPVSRDRKSGPIKALGN